MNEVSEFFACENRNAQKGTSTLKEKKGKSGVVCNNRNINNILGTNAGTKIPVYGPEQVAPSKRIQELMRQFGAILRQASTILEIYAKTVKLEFDVPFKL